MYPYQYIYEGGTEMGQEQPSWRSFWSAKKYFLNFTKETRLVAISEINCCSSVPDLATISRKKALNHAANTFCHIKSLGLVKRIKNSRVFFDSTAICSQGKFMFQFISMLTFTESQ